jgi:hypothetical protein
MEKILLENIEDIFKTLGIKAKSNSPLMVIKSNECAKNVPTQYISRRPFGRIDLSIFIPKRDYYIHEDRKHLVNLKLMGYNTNIDIDFELTFKSLKGLSVIDNGIFFTEYEKNALKNKIRKIKLNQI